MQVFPITPDDLVEAKLYPDKETVVHDALRYLFQNRPDVRIDFAVYRYQYDQDLSLAKAAALAGVSFERMKDILHSRGIPSRLGPETLEEAKEEIDAMERWLNERPD
jgi:predicted HTH domain antitoxin